MGDLAGEARTLNKMAAIYEKTDRSEAALKIHENVLRMRRLAGDRVGEAKTLGNMALVYSRIGQLENAVRRNEEAFVV